MALELDPYPREAGEVFNDIEEQPESAKVSPFTGLSKLKPFLKKEPILTEKIKGCFPKDCLYFHDSGDFPLLLLNNSARHVILRG